MKRKLKKVMFILTVMVITVSVLVSPAAAVEEENNDKYIFSDEYLSGLTDRANQSYEKYFENEHGFYLPQEEKANKVARFNDMIQSQNSSSINKSTNNLSSKINLEGFVGNSEIAFFAIGDTIYRYHYNSNTLDKVFEDENIVEYYPITNNKLLWRANNETKDVTSEITCIEKINSDYSYYVHDIKAEVNYPVDNAEYFFELTAISSYTDLYDYSTTINGKTIPHPDYPTLNPNVYPYKYATSMSEYSGAYQCAAFSRFIFDYIYGYPKLVDGENGVKTPINVSGPYIYQYLNDIPVGSNLCLTTSNNRPHYAILVYKGSDGYIFYHSNWGGNNDVRMTLYSSSDLAVAYNLLDYVRSRNAIPGLTSAPITIE